MECANIKELLSEYIDGVLDVQTEALVEEHLSICRGCREELASLKVVVEELGSLESVEAPKDFLEKLHERMERKFTFRKLIRVLFVPVRLKVPLEAATVLAIVILILGGLYTHQPEKQVAELPEGPTPVRVAKRTAGDRVEPALKTEAYEPQPAFEEATVERSGREGKTIELALLLKTEPPENTPVSGTAMVASPAPEKGGRAIEEGKGDMISPPTRKFGGQTVSDVEMKAGVVGEEERAVELPMRERSPSKEKAGAPFSQFDEALFNVKDLIGRVDGRVLSIEYDEQTGEPRSIRAEIPSKSYNSFYKELGRFALLQTPAPPLSERDEDTVQLRIRFIPSE